MKKEYKKPLIINHNQDVNLFPVLALVGAYVVGRGVTKMMDAQPIIKEKDLKCLK